VIVIAIMRICVSSVSIVTGYGLEVKYSTSGTVCLTSDRVVNGSIQKPTLFCAIQELTNSQFFVAMY